jgi:hypothetical protein
MKIKNFLKVCLSIFVGSALLFSCADDFTEEDLLNAQFDLQQKRDSINIARLNEAGKLVKFNLTVVDLDGTPVQGLSVRMAAAGAGGDADLQTLTTDQQGNVFFDRVVVGGNTVTVTGTNITQATLLANFGRITNGVHYTTINSAVIPTPVTHNAVITVISKNAATATVTGTVAIETDLTNETREVPQGVTLMADFTTALVRAHDNINGFSLAYFGPNTGVNNRNLGVAEVNTTTGAYTMTVPANIVFAVVVPSITANQRIAVKTVEELHLDVPEYRQIPTNFGPGLGTSAIPNVPGARFVFPEAAGGGKGLGLTGWSRVPRNVNVSNINTVATTWTNRSENDGLVFQFTSVGANYTQSPKVTITDPTGTNRYAAAHIRMAIKNLALDKAGSGFATNTFINFHIIEDRITFDGTKEVKTQHQTRALNVLAIRTNSIGVITADSVAKALNKAIADKDLWFDPTSPQLINANVENVRLQTAVGEAVPSTAVILITGATSRVDHFQYRGLDLTNPTFAFTGGGTGATQAAITVFGFATQWNFTLNNTTVTENYASLPNIRYKWENAAVNPTITTSNQVQRIDADGGVISSNQDINNWVKIVAGKVIFQHTNELVRTQVMSVSQPVADIVEPTPGITPKLFATVNPDGRITGALTSLLPFNVTGTVTDNSGTGYYNSPAVTIVPSAVGAPGAGAVVSYTGALNADGTYRITNLGNANSVVNAGAAYLQNLNIQTSRGTTNISGNVPALAPGAVHVRNIDYGTGLRTVVVD